MIFHNMEHVVSFQLTLPSMCNRNQDNDVTQLCLEEILLLIFLRFYFHAIIEGVLETKKMS